MIQTLYLYKKLMYHCNNQFFRHSPRFITYSDKPFCIKLIFRDLVTPNKYKPENKAKAIVLQLEANKYI